MPDTYSWINAYTILLKLMKNKTAGYVVELAYNDFSSALQRNAMLQEFLGPEYRLFKVAEEAVAIFDALSS